MDDPRIPWSTHEVALAGLARLNRWSRSDAGLWSVLQAEAKQVAPLTLRVLDLATGSGDLPVRLAYRARRAKVNLSLAGCDVSPTAIEIAKQHAKKNSVNIEFFQRDIVLEELPEGYDVIITSLFLHHLTDPDAIQLLRRMAESAERLVLVNDLNRSRFNLGLVMIASRFLSGHSSSTMTAPHRCGRHLQVPSASTHYAGRIDECRGCLAISLSLAAFLEEARMTEIAATLWDAIIIGAGPAGSTLALDLTRRGLRVLLVDQSPFPRGKVCGGCMNGNALAALDCLGLADLPMHLGGQSDSKPSARGSGSHGRTLPRCRRQHFTAGIRCGVDGALPSSRSDIPERRAGFDGGY